MNRRTNDLNRRTDDLSRRIRLLDALRGLALVNMIVYHGMYDWVSVFGRSAAWFTGTNYAHGWQQAICWTFLLVAGAVFPYGRSPLRRGALVFGCGMLLTVVTLLVMPSERILFGVLHLIGAAILITALLRRVLEKIPALPGAIGSFTLFLLLRGVSRGIIGIGAFSTALPRGLYQSPVLFPLGFPGPGFFSADYFPVIPWLFLFWTGMFFWRFLRPYAEEKLRGKKVCRPLEWFGRHSLIIYLLHQPALMVIVYLLTRLADWMHL